jgi:hypothetical protein
MLIIWTSIKPYQGGEKMGWVTKVLFFFLTVLTIMATAGFVLADDAQVLPKGVSNVNVSGTFWSTVDERYGPDGSVEGIDTDFNSVLDSNVFFFIPPGENIGRTIVDFEYERTDMEISYQYGMSDRITVGLLIPYTRFKTNLIEARVDTADATTTGLNAVFGPGLTPGDPITDAIVTGTVLQALEDPPYLFDPFESWSESGIGDIQIGMRYQYYNNDDWMLAFTGGVILPTGEADDPDNLLDNGFGRGATAYALHFNNDFIGLDDLRLNGTFKYTFVPPDKEVLRVLSDVNQPLAPASNKEKVDRDLGDLIQISLTGNYSIAKGWGLNVGYGWNKRLKDEIDGSGTLNYQSLEDETDGVSQTYSVGVSYSTMPLFMEKAFSVPLTASLLYWNKFDGENNSLKTEYMKLGLSVYF